MRADARRNHAQLLEAAREVVIERGADAPLDQIARRAGLGIATLYRRFPDRGALLTAVVADALESSRAAAERAHDEAGPADHTGAEALAAYLHALIDLRVSAVMPMVLDREDLDEEVVGPLREASARAFERLIERAHEDGSLSKRVTFGDIGTLLVRLSRPLPGGLSVSDDLALAHRHLGLALAGMGAEVLDEEGWSRRELTDLRAR